MKSYTRILIIAGIVVLAALAVWKGVGRPKVASGPSATNSSSPSPLTSITPVAIAYDGAPKEWKTYRASASMGFTVSYPPDWRAGICGPQCVGWAPETTASGQFVLGVFASNGTLDDILTKAQPFLIAKEDIKTGGLSWLKLTLRQPQTNVGVTTHFIAHGTQVYEFGIATADPDILVTYGRMIGSFKFTK